MSGKLIKDLTEIVFLSNNNVMEIQDPVISSTNKVRLDKLLYYDINASNDNLVYNTDGFKVWLDVVYSHVYSATPARRRALVTVTALMPPSVSPTHFISDQIIPTNLRPEARVVNRFYNNTISGSYTQLAVLGVGDTDHVSLHNDLGQSRMISVTYGITVLL